MASSPCALPASLRVRTGCRRPCCTSRSQARSRARCRTLRRRWQRALRGRRRKYRSKRDPTVATTAKKTARMVKEQKIGRASCRERVKISEVAVSSRRRHTRCLSDWSSDVCSSDLTHGMPATVLHVPEPSKIESTMPDSPAKMAAGAARPPEKIPEQKRSDGSHDGKKNGKDGERTEDRKSVV